MIDIGGPALLRAAAKNFVDVVPVCETARYGEILDRLRNGGVDLDARRMLAAEAFAHTAAYEASIATWFADIETFPPQLLLSLERVDELVYGENPHQRAAYYAEAGVAAAPALARRAARRPRALVQQPQRPRRRARSSCASSRCRAASSSSTRTRAAARVAATLEEAYEKALASDPVSAYGGVVALNRRSRRELGARLAEQFVEVLIAPEYDDEALAVLAAKESLRILRGPRAARHDARRPRLSARDRRVPRPGRGHGDRRPGRDERRDRRRHPDETAWGDLLFAWRVGQARRLERDRRSRRTSRRSGSAAGR